jgi:regulator of sigma D
MNESAERIEPGIGAFRRTRRRWVFAEALHRRASELVRQLFALLQDRTETIPLFYQPTYMTEEKTGNTAEYRQWLKTEEELRQQATQAAAFLLALSGDDALYAFVASEQDAVQHRTFMLPWLHNVE